MNTFSTSGGSRTRHWMNSAGDWLRRHRLATIAAVAAAIGLAFGWNWLAAVGVLPLLFAMLPCTLMLGMCMRGMNGNSKTAPNEATQSTNDGEASQHVASPQINLQLEDQTNA